MIPIKLTPIATIAVADRCPLSSRGMIIPVRMKGMAMANEESASCIAPSGFCTKKSVAKNKTTQIARSAAFQYPRFTKMNRSRFPLKRQSK